jgi:hypothetical protein
MHFSPKLMLGALGEYLWLTVSGAAAARLASFPQRYLDACSAVVLMSTAAAIAISLWKRKWLVLFFAGWYLLTLAPYLPLVNHIQDYYLTIPAIGFAMLGGWVIGLAWQANFQVKTVAAVAVLCLVIPCGWQAWSMSQWYSAKSRKVRSLVRGLATVHARYPDRWIVLQGVDDDLFWYGVYDKPEAALGWPRQVYMTAETRPLLSPVRDEDISDRFLPQAVTLAAIRNNQAVVYDVSGARLRNITEPFLRVRAQSPEANQLPGFIDAANPLFAPFLKNGWYPADNLYRWTSKRAVVELAGPSAAGASVRLRGRVTPLHTGQKPLYVTTTADGTNLGTQPIPRNASEFELTYPLPAGLKGKDFH